MRHLTLSVIAVGAMFAAPVTAQHLGAGAPAKSPVPAEQTRVRDRQGGDTMADAFLVPALPYSDVGTTLGYADDYDEGSPTASPDVVYRLQVAAPRSLVIDLCGSGFDTKLYVWREDRTLVAINVDFYFFDPHCGAWVSRLDDVRLDPAVKYFIVIDGEGGEAGDYSLAIFDHDPPGPACPPDAQAFEGEPPLVNDYVDHYDGGCNTEPDHPFRYINAFGGGTTFCGRSGWYLAGGEPRRDTDWYELGLNFNPWLEITAEAQQATYVFELSPHDCAEVAVVQSILVEPGAVGHLTINGPLGSTVWLWVGPSTFSPPGGEPPVSYDYVLWLDFGIASPGVIATERITWSSVKALHH